MEATVPEVTAMVGDTATAEVTFPEVTAMAITEAVTTGKAGHWYVYIHWEICDRVSAYLHRFSCT
jgi:hypothetical protein